MNASTKRTKNTPADPGVWKLFERAVDAAIKSGPKHRTLPETKRMPGKGRVTTGKAKKR